MSNKTAIMLHSSDVMALLDKNPEIVLGLQAMAAEKVAEEIKRKTEKELAGENVNRIVKKAIYDAEVALKNKWSFPPEAKAVVGEIAREVVNVEIDRAKANVINGAKVKIDEMLKQAEAKIEKGLKLAQDEFRVWVDKELRSMARAEFVAVMREVRESVK